MSGLGGIILLGVIQGLTEFLPVSSSGHLVLGQHILKLAEPDLTIDIILHVGTLMPVLWLYRRDLLQMIISLRRLPAVSRHWAEDGALRLVVCVVLGTIPTGLAGVLLKDVFEQAFKSTAAVGVALFVTGGILMLTRIRRQTETQEPYLTLNVWRALAVGLGQSMAITPGISRSGTTIAVGLLVGIEREMVARLSFVMSIPAIVGATILQLSKANFAGGQLGLYAAGAVAAAISGYLALRWVVALVRKGEMHWFSFYLWPLGIAVVIYSFVM